MLYYTVIEFVILLHTFIVNSFAPHKEYISWWTSFSKCSDVLPAFTCLRTNGNLWSIFIGDNILRYVQLETLAKRAKFEACRFPCVSFPFGKMLLLKPLRTFCLPLWIVIAFSKVSKVFCLGLSVFWVHLNLTSSFKFICSSSALIPL